MTTTFFRALVATFAVVLAWASPSAAQQDDPESEEQVVVTAGTDDLAGLTESGVSIEGLSAVVEAGGPTVRGVASSCSWGVAYDPTGSQIYDADHEGPGVTGSVGAVATYGLTQNASAEHRELGGGNDLRYVYNYGSGCNELVQAWIALADVEAVAQIAFDNLKRTWPTQDIALGWPEPLEDTWTALRADLAWEPISASASDSGIAVTVTATPVRIVWDIGEINGRYGGTERVVCDDPGNMPRDQGEASCKVWFAGPSTELTDRNGLIDTAVW